VVDRIVVLRRGKVVAHDIDPRTTTIEEVEQVITGDLQLIDGELRAAPGLAPVAADGPPASSPPPA